MTKGEMKEIIPIKKNLFSDFIKGSTPMLYHIAMAVLSAALALSLPVTARFVAKKFLEYWSLIGNDKVFLASIEMTLGILFIFISTAIYKSWKYRKFSNMARTAGIVFVTPARGFWAKRRVRKLKERHGLARDVMVISSTGFRTLVDTKGDLHQVIASCREAKIMLLNPFSEGAKTRVKSILDPNITIERFGEQIGKSILFLKGLKAIQKNIKLKLYNDPPFLKLLIMGDYMWIQYYHTGLDVQRMPEYVFKHDQNLGSLYLPLYQYFLTQWNHPDIPEYDLESDELIYRDRGGNEVKRKKFDDLEGKRVTSKVSSHQDIDDSVSLHASRNGIYAQDLLPDGGHRGGKEFFLLSSKNPTCEGRCWITLL
jgi:hypothetical protein